MTSKHDLVSFRPASRRFFLKCAGASLALPFLPSLTGKTEAQPAAFERVVFLPMANGLLKAYWAPEVPGASQVGDHIRTTPLRDVTLPMYFDTHFDDLKHKFSLVQGLGVTGGCLGHYNSAALGCSPRAETGGSKYRPTSPDTIDVILGRSRSVYPSGSAMDVLRLANRARNAGGPEHGYWYSNYSKLTALAPQAAYNRLYPDGLDASEPSEPPADSGPSDQEVLHRRRLLRVNAILERYRAVQRSSSLSAADAAVLEQSLASHMALQRQLEAATGTGGGGPILVGGGCQPLSFGSNFDNQALAEANALLITQAFACNATRIATIELPTNHDADGAHQANSSANASPTGLYTGIVRENLKYLSILLRTMDSVIEANGKSILDNSLVVFCCDHSTSSVQTHSGVDAPVLLAGGLNGKYRMGEVIDYSNHDLGPLARKATVSGVGKNKHSYYAGPPTNELMISIMKSFGLEADEWEHGGRPGFGFYSLRQSPHHDVVVKPNGKRVAGANVQYHDYLDSHHYRQSPPGSELPYIKTS